ALFSTLITLVAGVSVFIQAEDGIRDATVTGVQTCALPIFRRPSSGRPAMATFKAIVIEKTEGGQKVGLADFDEGNLMDGDVTVRSEERRVGKEWCVRVWFAG